MPPTKLQTKLHDLERPSVTNSSQTQFTKGIFHDALHLGWPVDVTSSILGSPVEAKPHGQSVAMLSMPRPALPRVVVRRKDIEQISCAKIHDLRGVQPVGGGLSMGPIPTPYVARSAARCKCHVSTGLGQFLVLSGAGNPRCSRDRRAAAKCRLGDVDGLVALREYQRNGACLCAPVCALSQVTSGVHPRLSVPAPSWHQTAQPRDCQG